MKRAARLLGAIAWLGGCAPAAPRALRLEPFPPQLGHTDATPEPAPRPAPPRSREPAAAEGSRFELLRDRTTLAVPPGRFVIPVSLPSHRTVVVAVAGPASAVRRFEVLGRGPLRRVETLRGDGELPSFVTFPTPADPEPLLVVVDADAPVALHRIDLGEADVGTRRHGPNGALPLVGLRPPTSAKSGYALATAPRYGFLRADAAEALRIALREVRRRFEREPIAIGDASQWNGERPASDRHLPRHVSHHEGRDVDVGLPGSDGDSSIRHRCKLVVSPPDRAMCEPGSVVGLDAERLAYLLALLVEGPSPRGRFVADSRRRPGPIAPVELVFADPELIAAVRSSVHALRARRWVHDEAVSALDDDRILRASPWHTDHVHVRFAGAPARVPDALRAIVASP